MSSVDGLNLPLIAKILFKRQLGVYGNRASRPRKQALTAECAEHAEKKKMISGLQEHKKVFSALSAISAVRVLGRFTAEDTENAEKKMALINYMKFGFSEPAPAPHSGQSQRSEPAPDTDSLISAAGI